MHLGRTGALQAAAFFIAMNGFLTAIVGPGFGHATLRFPLYLAEAAIVELVPCAWGATARWRSARSRAC